MASYYWSFYPILGLQIEPTDDLCTYLWEGATIIASEEREGFLKCIGYVTEQDDDDLRLVRLGKGDSFLAIRANTDDFAGERALEVASVLSLLFLSLQDFRYSCSLPDENSGDRRQFIPRIYGHGHIGYTEGILSRSWLTFYPEPQFQVTREKLESILTASNLSSLHSILLSKQNPVHKSFYSRLSTTTKFLYSIIHNPLPETQLTGSVTIIDKLLSSGGSNFRLLSERIESLIGSTSFDTHSVETVLKIRHDITHSGAFTESGYARNAIQLAMAVLLAFSNAAYKFKSHEEFLHILDLHSAIRKTGDHKTELFKLLPSSGIPQLPAPPDYLPSKLVNYLYSRSGAGATASEEIALKYATMIKVLADIRLIDENKAFSKIRDTIIDSQFPFQSFDEYTRFKIDNDDKLSANVDHIHEHINDDMFGHWRFVL